MKEFLFSLFALGIFISNTTVVEAMDPKDEFCGQLVTYLNRPHNEIVAYSKKVQIGKVVKEKPQLVHEFFENGRFPNLTLSSSEVKAEVEKILEPRKTELNKFREDLAESLSVSLTHVTYRTLPGRIHSYTEPELRKHIAHFRSNYLKDSEVNIEVVFGVLLTLLGDALEFDQSGAFLQDVIQTESK